MQRDSNSPLAYRNEVTGEQSDIIEAIRTQILMVAPDVEEIIEHGMLGYPGLANLGAQKHHVALYVMPEVLAKHRDAFTGVDCGKSCVRFRRVDQIDSGALRSLFQDVLSTRRRQRSE
jgi:uncharacterized protein YdhG (YjbR/CyaY superfamily)